MKKIIEAFLIGIVIFFGVCIFLLANHIGKWRAFVVLSPSMEPTITTGSLIITQQIHPKNLKINDIITFIRPDKTREFITHRIIKISQNGSVTLFHTKGDKNNTSDNWILAGGGVVGKVIYALPNLGYLLSLSKTKIGIAFLILIPAVIILYIELTNIFVLLHSWKIKRENKPSTEVFMLFLFAFLLYSLFPKPTYALLSHKVSLLHNTFTIALPSSSGNCNNGLTSVTINGNGNGSTNTVSVICQNTTTITQTNNSISTTTINTSSNTGGHASNNNAGSTFINSGSSTSTLHITQTGNTNIVK